MEATERNTHSEMNQHQNQNQDARTRAYSRNMIDDAHPTFRFYRDLIRPFAADFVERFAAEMHAHPVGSRIFTSSAVAKPRIGLSAELTIALGMIGLPVALRTIYPPHGLYYYTIFPGADDSPGVPARIVHYNEKSQTVDIVVGDRPGLTDRIYSVYPGTELQRADRDEHFKYTHLDFFYLYTRLGGAEGIYDLAVLLDPLGFMKFGL